ncbi:MAG: porin [Herminiimonas sp.]|nr:porin [Herminiimonas sp.]
MKKSLIALAVLGAVAGAASAQTNVTIYGVVDAGIGYRDNGNPAGKTLSQDSGVQSGSRLGFKGSEDLGGGLSAIFTLENGFNVDDGSLAQGGRLFGRQAWVGLNGGFGAVKLGRQTTALYNALLQVDPFQINLAGNAQRVFGYGLYAADPLSRTDNTISYSTPNVGGFSGSVSYGFGEQAGDNSAKRNVGVGAAYVNGPLNVQFAYQDSATAGLTTQVTSTLGLPAAATADLKAAFIGATYNFGVAKAHLAFADNKLELAGETVKDRNWLAGVSVPVSAAGTVLASYIRNDVRNADNAQSDQYAIGYTHALSKRTNLYTSYSYLKNDSNVAVNAYSGATGGETVRVVNVGVRHSF